MNYYPFHIGDYAAHTAHLTNEEDLAYRRLLDLYYLHERPFNDRSTVARKIRISEEIVNIILEEFFVFDENIGWFHPRADAEIDKYKSKQTQAQLAGKASAAARKKSKINGRSTDVQRTFNQPEPITNNQIYLKEEKNLIKKERQKKESEPKKTATTIPKDWQPTEDDIEFCRREKPTLDWRRVQTSFVSYYLSQTGRNAKSSDWSARWRYWVSNARVEKQSEFERRRAWVEGLTGSGKPTEKLIGKEDCDEF